MPLAAAAAAVLLLRLLLLYIVQPATWWRCTATGNAQYETGTRRVSSASMVMNERLSWCALTSRVPSHALTQNTDRHSQ